MSATGLDAAIRKAIDRADARDASARERVYRSARMALETGIAQRPDLDRATIEAQRRRFDEVVRSIEAEKSKTGASELVEPPAVAVEADGVAPPVLEPLFVARRTSEASREAPPVEPSPRRATVAEPAMDAAAADFGGLADEVRADRPTKTPAEKKDKPKKRPERQRKGRGAARLFSALFLLVSLLIFGWLGLRLLDKTGLIEPAETVGRSASTFTKFDADSKAMHLVTEDGFVGAWKPVFLPGKLGEVTAGPAAKKMIVSDERGKALRLTSATAGPDGEIRVAIPADVLDSMAGRVSVIAMNVRGVDGQQTQIALECAFGPAGGCDRFRFPVHAEMTDVVFKIDLRKASPPRRPGALVLNTDIEGKGRPIDLFAVGLRPAQ